jgi:hypothetical protein
MAANTPFRVTWMANCNAGVLALGQRVTVASRTRLREIVLEADARLKESARTWGDPYIDLKGMRMTVYARTFLRDGLTVWYAVHVDRDDVFVRSVEPITNGPFDVE